MSITELVTGLRNDSRDYGRKHGHGRPVEEGETLMWDQSEVRAWEAAALLETLTIAATAPLAAGDRPRIEDPL